MIDVAVLQRAGDISQAGAKNEGLHPIVVLGEPVDEVQQNARIAVHRARNIAEHDNRRWPLPPPHKLR